MHEAARHAEVADRQVNFRSSLAKSGLKIPVAVTRIAPETVRANEVKSAIDLQALAPSLTVSADLGSRDDDVFTIRGQSQPFGGADPGVQTYFAEVPFGASGPGNYYDMDSIQVLRGPQGTLDAVHVV